jgi:hypothetical protein
MITIAQVTATELRGASEKKKGSGWSIAPEVRARVRALLE